MKRFKYILLITLIVIFSIEISFAGVEQNDNIVGPKRIGESIDLSVPLYQQVGVYNCGPACIRMALKKFGITKTENQLASEAGTNSSGTTVANVTSCLNKNLGKTAYTSRGTWNTSFTDKTIASLKAGYPVICHVKPNKLPNYSKDDPSGGHYVIVKGYSLQAGAVTTIILRYNDPNYKDANYGSYSVTAEKMLTSINNMASWYISA